MIPATRARGRAAAALAVCVLGAALHAGAAATPNAEALLQRSDVGAFAPSAFRARLSLRTGPSAAPHQIEIWRAGQARTLVRFLDSKERGKYLLRLGGDLWLITRGAKAPVRLNPSYRLYGGVTLDEVLGVRLARDYVLKSAEDGADPGGAVVVFELEAKAAHSLFPGVRYVVRAATERPLRAEYRLRSGRAATAVEFVAWSDARPLYAKRVTVKDLLRKGQVTDVEVVELQAREVPEALFDLRDPSARQALEKDRRTAE
jgi:Outer membrane lipoprotein-sorting protein